MLLSIVSMLKPGAGLAEVEDCEKQNALIKITHSTRLEQRIMQISSERMRPILSLRSMDQQTEICSRTSVRNPGGESSGEALSAFNMVIIRVYRILQTWGSP
jgi:hypothetical protein